MVSKQWTGPTYPHRNSPRRRRSHCPHPWHTNEDVGRFAYCLWRILTTQLLRPTECCVLCHPSPVTHHEETTSPLTHNRRRGVTTVATYRLRPTPTRLPHAHLLRSPVATRQSMALRTDIICCMGISPSYMEVPPLPTCRLPSSIATNQKRAQVAWVEPIQVKLRLTSQ